MKKCVGRAEAFGSPWLGLDPGLDVQDLRAIARGRQANGQMKVTKIERVVQAREDELRVGTDLEVRQRGESDKESEAARSGRVLNARRTGQRARNCTCMWNWRTMGQISDSID